MRIEYFLFFWLLFPRVLRCKHSFEWIRQNREVELNFDRRDDQPYVPVIVDLISTGLAKLERGQTAYLKLESETAECEVGVADEVDSEVLYLTFSSSYLFSELTKVVVSEISEKVAQKTFVCVFMENFLLQFKFELSFKRFDQEEIQNYFLFNSSDSPEQKLFVTRAKKLFAEKFEWRFGMHSGTLYNNEKKYFCHSVAAQKVRVFATPWNLHIKEIEDLV